MAQSAKSTRSFRDLTPSRRPSSFGTKLFTVKKIEGENVENLVTVATDKDGKEYRFEQRIINYKSGPRATFADDLKAGSIFTASGVEQKGELHTAKFVNFLSQHPAFESVVSIPFASVAVKAYKDEQGEEKEFVSVNLYGEAIAVNAKEAIRSAIESAITSDFVPHIANDKSRGIVLSFIDSDKKPGAQFFRLNGVNYVDDNGAEQVYTPESVDAYVDFVTDLLEGSFDDSIESGFHAIKVSPWVSAFGSQFLMEQRPAADYKPNPSAPARGLAAYVIETRTTDNGTTYSKIGAQPSYVTISPYWDVEALKTEVSKTGLDAKEVFKAVNGKLSGMKMAEYLNGRGIDVKSHITGYNISGVEPQKWPAPVPVTNALTGVEYVKPEASAEAAAEESAAPAADPNMADLDRELSMEAPF